MTSAGRRGSSGESARGRGGGGASAGGAGPGGAGLHPGVVHPGLHPGSIPSSVPSPVPPAIPGSLPSYISAGSPRSIPARPVMCPVVPFARRPAGPARPGCRCPALPKAGSGGGRGRRAGRASLGMPPGLRLRGAAGKGRPGGGRRWGLCPERGKRLWNGTGHLQLLCGVCSSRALISHCPFLRFLYIYIKSAVASFIKIPLRA